MFLPVFDARELAICSHCRYRKGNIKRCLIVFVWESNLKMRCLVKILASCWVFERARRKAETLSE